MGHPLCAMLSCCWRLIHYLVDIQVAALKSLPTYVTRDFNDCLAWRTVSPNRTVGWHQQQQHQQRCQWLNIHNCFCKLIQMACYIQMRLSESGSNDCKFGNTAQAISCLCWPEIEFLDQWIKRSKNRTHSQKYCLLWTINATIRNTAL